MSAAPREIFENEPFTALTDDDRRFLQARIGGRLQHRQGGWVVTRLVGHIVTPAGTVFRVVSRKSRARNLLAWMTYVRPSLRFLQLDTLAAALAGEGDLSVLLVHLFLRELLAAVERHGLTMGYRQATSRGATLRGRIDFQHLLMHGHDLSRVRCTVWERAPDTPFNRLLAAAVRRIVVDPSLRSPAGDNLRVAERWFGAIPTTGVEALLQRPPALARSEESFRGAAELARLLLRLGGLGDGASHRGFSFLIDLERLFESAVQSAFVANLGEAHCTRQARVHYRRVTPHGTTRVAMSIDVLCHPPGRVVAVDAKFKHDLCAANIHQMATYCALTGAQHGALVLPGEAALDHEVHLALASTLKLRVLHLDTSSIDLRGWKSAGDSLAQRALAP